MLQSRIQDLAYFKVDKHPDSQWRSECYGIPRTWVLVLPLEYCLLTLILLSTRQFVEHFSTFLSTFNCLEEFIITDSAFILSPLTASVLDREHELVQEWWSKCPELKICKFDGKQTHRALDSSLFSSFVISAGVTWTLKRHLHRSAWVPKMGNVASTVIIYQWQLGRSAATARENIKQTSLT